MLDTSAEEDVGGSSPDRRSAEGLPQLARLKDEFLSILSHELRTPLTALLGWAQVLERGASCPAQHARAVAGLLCSARAQAQIIDDLLDVSRLRGAGLKLRVRTVGLQEVIASALDLARPAAQAKRIALELAVEAGDHRVRGDGERLRQVVWNLLANAIKFTPSGGAVTTTLAREGGSARITVRDTGQGIARETLPFVFDRFHQADSSSQREEGGLGLGLAIVRQLVELHGGTVAAVSEGPGRGAAFTVWIPLPRPHLLQEEEAPGEEELDMDDERLTELEIRYTHQAAMLQELSEVLFAQQKELARLQRTVEQLRGRMEAEPGLVDGFIEERPPHY